ncbi:hypothetical protein PAPYR_7188 [Paratrimastix pyriformis]|uniref:protein-serine/threonine phosphatase n=1 Tax=Paratrimastix pyriformis TaxID=342808 RepID=A0ABQ8UDQ0_9EUKA|nr:hypothetical protein PAPYR_7188 [Paratrimastix pyriformis]
MLKTEWEAQPPSFSRRIFFPLLRERGVTQGASLSDLCVIEFMATRVLDGVVAVIKVFFEDGQPASEAELQKKLEELGAKVVSRLPKTRPSKSGQSITHLIYKNAPKADFNAAAAQDIHIVSPLWVDKCFLTKTRQPEDDYIVTDAAASSQKRRKSLVPGELPERLGGTPSTPATVRPPPLGTPASTPSAAADSTKTPAPATSSSPLALNPTPTPAVSQQPPATPAPAPPASAVCTPAPAAALSLRLDDEGEGEAAAEGRTTPKKHGREGGLASQTAALPASSQKRGRMEQPQPQQPGASVDLDEDLGLEPTHGASPPPPPPPSSAAPTVPATPVAPPAAAKPRAAKSPVIADDDDEEEKGAGAGAGAGAGHLIPSPPATPAPAKLTATAAALQATKTPAPAARKPSATPAATPLRAPALKKHPATPAPAIVDDDESQPAAAPKGSKQADKGKEKPRQKDKPKMSAQQRRVIAEMSMRRGYVSLCVAVMCRYASRLCVAMRRGYVSRLCVAVMCRDYVSRLCVAIMCRDYVSRLCVAIMCRDFVSLCCVLCVVVSYVSLLCVAIMCRYYVSLLCVAIMCRYYVSLLCVAIMCRYYVSLLCVAIMCRCVPPCDVILGARFDPFCPDAPPQPPKRPVVADDDESQQPSAAPARPFSLHTAPHRIASPPSHLTVIGLTCMDSRKRAALVEKMMESTLEATILDEEASPLSFRRLTHLVVAEKRRNFKVMMAIAKGAQIVRPGWLERSIETGQWAPEDEFRAEFFPAFARAAARKPEDAPLLGQQKFHLRKGAEFALSREYIRMFPSPDVCVVCTPACLSAFGGRSHLHLRAASPQASFPAHPTATTTAVPRDFRPGDPLLVTWMQE